MPIDELTPVLTADEVAVALRVSADHVRRLAKKGALPALLIGHGPKPRVLFRRNEIKRLIDGVGKVDG
jgi:excisionase family DNA binding protein